MVMTVMVNQKSVYTLVYKNMKCTENSAIAQQLANIGGATICNWPTLGVPQAVTGQSSKCHKL